MRHLVLAYPDDPPRPIGEDEFLFGPDLLVAPVLTPGATTREAYLPAGAWIDFWRAVAFDSARRRARARRRRSSIAGGRPSHVPAPLDELPLLVRAGAVLALLPPDVDTLADYGAGTPGLVRLADRRDALNGCSPSRAARRKDGSGNEAATARSKAGAVDAQGPRRATDPT